MGILNKMVNTVATTVDAAKRTAEKVADYNSKRANGLETEGDSILHCGNCGAKLADGAKFCQKCGATANGEPFKQEGQRQQEYAGAVLKCPNCGEGIPSLTAICPACGHEISSSRASASLEAFIKEINDCDKRIENSPEGAKKGWSSWGGWKKTGWVILNIYFMCIPLLIYLLRPSHRVDRNRSLTNEESHKVSVIENFNFPNNRGPILEAMLFIQSKIGFLSNEKADSNTAYWMQLWAKKAEQLHAKAEMLFPDDKIASDTYNKILEDTKKMKKKMQMRILVTRGAVAIAIVLLFVWVWAIVAEADIPDINQSLSSVENPKETSQSFSADNINIPPDFIFGYEEAEFSKYNSPASENGLGGNKIYLVGTLQKTEIFEDDEYKIILGQIIDKESNLWLVLMNYVPRVSETNFNPALGKPVVCTTVYEGYSGELDMPVTILNELLILEDGTILNGAQKAFDE